LIFVVVTGGGVTSNFPGRIASRHHADLALQVESLLCHRRKSTQALPGSSYVRIRYGFIHADADLAAPVVSTSADLEKYAVVQFMHCIVQLSFIPHHAKWTNWKLLLSQPRLLQRLILDDPNRLDTRA
jgi:hypothetical protein